MRVAFLIRALLTLLAAILLLPQPARAQVRATTADLALAVKDESGGALPGATVTVTNADTGLTRSAVAESDGRLAVPALPLGSYDVRIELNGFQSAHRDVTLRLGTVTELPITLRLASVQASVTVVAAEPLVDLRRTVVASVVDERQIRSLPIDRRNYISFATLAPGVSSDRTPLQGPTESSGLTFTGQSARVNNITVDGLDNNDDAVGGVRALFSQEAVREFEVLVTSYSAEFGKSSGGVVNIVTRSGTNHLNGGVFGFYRDRALNARGHFDDFDAAGRRINAAKSPFQQWQYGATLGGPIRRNRTFAFGSVERLAIDNSASVTIDDQTLVSHPILAVVLGTPAGILRKAGFPVETGAVPYAVRSTTGLVRIDHAFTGAKTLTVRYNGADGFNGNSQPFGGLIAKSRGGLLDNRDHVAAASFSSIHRSRIVNELRGQVAHRHQVVRSLDPACGGACIGEDQGGPAVDVAGVASVGRYALTPQERLNIRYQIVDTIGWDVGPHALKAGVDLNVFDNRKSTLPLQFGGQFVFVNFAAGQAAALGLPTAVSAIQAVALGLPAAYVQGYGDSSVSQTFKNVSVFAQDEWRLSARLTARLGLRYQKQAWPDDAYRAPGYPNEYHVTSGNNQLAPRLGVSWDPAGDGRTAIHAAYGIFFANQFNAPVATTKIVDGVQLRAVVVPTAQAIAAWKSPARHLPNSALTPYPSLTLAVDPNYTSPHTHQVTFGVQRELPHAISVSATGVIVEGRNYPGIIDYNPIDTSLGVNRRPLDVNGVAGTSASVSQYTSWGKSWYRGLLVSADKRWANGSRVQASYTLSKAEDSITDFFGLPPQSQGHGRNPADVTGLPLGFDPSLERGPSLQDQRHRLVMSGSYALPWQIQAAGILTAGSGRPYNIIVGADLNGDGDATVNPGPDRPRRVPTDASTSIGRNAGRLPSETRLDLRLARHVSLGRHAQATFILDVLNAFNTTIYTDVNRVFGAGAYPSAPLSTFGQFTQAAAPRQIQIGIRTTF